jgi:hypothetical protein
MQKSPHIVDFNDQVDFQIEPFYYLPRLTTLNSNIALALRDYDYEFNQTTFRAIIKNWTDPPMFVTFTFLLLYSIYFKTFSSFSLKFTFIISH